MGRRDFDTVSKGGSEVRVTPIFNPSVNSKQPHLALGERENYRPVVWLATRAIKSNGGWAKAPEDWAHSRTLRALGESPVPDCKWLEREGLAAAKIFFNHRWRSWGGAADIARGIDDPEVFGAMRPEKSPAVIRHRWCAEGWRASRFRHDCRGRDGFSRRP